MLIRFTASRCVFQSTSTPGVRLTVVAFSDPDLASRVVKVNSRREAEAAFAAFVDDCKGLGVSFAARARKSSDARAFPGWRQTHLACDYEHVPSAKQEM